MHILDKNHKDQPPLVPTLIQPCELEVKREVLLTDAKIAPSTKVAFSKIT